VHNFVLGRLRHIRYALPVACTTTSPDLQSKVAEFWNSEPCGTRYLGDTLDFEAHARARYTLEPHIPSFAHFSAARGLRVLIMSDGSELAPMQSALISLSLLLIVLEKGANEPDCIPICASPMRKICRFQTIHSMSSIPTESCTTVPIPHFVCARLYES